MTKYIELEALKNRFAKRLIGSKRTFMMSILWDYMMVVNMIQN